MVSPCFTFAPPPQSPAQKFQAASLYHNSVQSPGRAGPSRQHVVGREKARAPLRPAPGVVRVSRNSAAGDLHGNSLSDSGPSPTGLRATRLPPRRFSRDRARRLASSLVAHVSRNDAGSAGARDLGPEPGGEPNPGRWMSGVLTKLTNA